MFNVHQKSAQEERLYACPCCGKNYVAVVTAAYWNLSQILSAPGFALCEDCGKPCCQNCQYVGGQRVICTRCTTYPDCTHARQMQ